MNDVKIREQIIQIGSKLHAKNMLAAADGNISFKIDDQKILITPSGHHKSFLKTSDLVTLNIQGECLSQGTPSSESKMHLEVYRQCPEAKAVLHAHPPYAIAWSLAHMSHSQVPDNVLSELILGAGHIPIIPYVKPGSMEMAQSLREFLPECRAMILSRHGAITWGESLMEAYNGMERIEHSIQILTLAKQLGGYSSLPKEDMDALRELKKKIGPQLR